ncbi:MAG: phosphonate metabolism protein PhnM [Chloroflexota bacterium]
MKLSNAKVVLPDQTLEQGTIEFENSLIVEIEEGGAAGDINLNGMTAIPGLIDVHGDMLEQTIQPRPKANIPYDIAITELDKRLTGCGVTTAYAAIGLAWSAEETMRSEERARGIMQALRELQDDTLIDNRIHVRFEITNPEAGDVLLKLCEEGLVDLVSLMDHTPGQGQYRDIEAYVKWTMAWRKQKGEAVSEEVVRTFIAERQARPKGWEAVNGIAEIAKEKDLIIASHDDDTAEKVAMMADFGVTLSEFPVTPEAAKAARENGMLTAMGAPNAFRGGSLNKNMSAWDAVIDGLVDILASDYYPASMLQAAYKFADEGIMPLHESIKLVSSNPAKSVKLNDRGSLEVGKRADIVIVDESKSRPRVRGVVSNGRKVFWDHVMHEL